MTGISGGYAYVGYDWVGGTSWKTFGHGVKLTTHEKKNNIETIYGIGSRFAQFLMGKQYEGALTVEYILSDPWVFKAIFGSSSVTGTSPYTHTFPASGNIPQPAALDMVVSIDGVNANFTYNDVYINNTTMNIAKDDVVKMTHEMIYKTEGYSNTLTLSSQPTEDFKPYAFQHGTLTLGGTTFASVQSLDLTINHNAEAIRGIGSRFNQDIAPKNLEITAKADILFTADNLELLHRFYTGATSGATAPSSTGYVEFSTDDTMTLLITNGETGTDERSITLTCTGIAIDSDAFPLSPEDIVKHDVNMKIKSISVSATNNTATVP